MIVEVVHIEMLFLVDKDMLVKLYYKNVESWSMTWWAYRAFKVCDAAKFKEMFCISQNFIDNILWTFEAKVTLVSCLRNDKSSSSVRMARQLNRRLKFLFEFSKLDDIWVF